MIDTTVTATTWLDANQRYLTAAIGWVRARLERHIAHPNDAGDDDAHEQAARDEMGAVAAGMAAPPALEAVRAAFGLSRFESALLLLCAATECNSKIAALCGAIQGDPQRVAPTFSLALAILPDPHWAAFAPRAPLRRALLIEVGSGPNLTLSPLRIDERILHYLTGVHYLDTRLAPSLEPPVVADTLLPSQQALAERLAAAWRHARTDPLPYMQLIGVDGASKRSIAAVACDALGFRCSAIAADAIPAAPHDFDRFVRLWEREATLDSIALFLDCEDTDPADAEHAPAITRFIDRYRGPLIVARHEPWRARHRPAITFDVPRSSVEEQGAAWRAALGDTAARLNGRMGGLVSQFNLSPSAIRAASDRVRPDFATTDASTIETLLWDACRAEARTRLDDLAQRIESHATWDDLVLPEAQRAILREVTVHVRQRAKVYSEWGFASRGARGLGISALFAGASGTGKTMAAEVLANELRLDLYRIDLSSVVNKYIGETEKNLRRVFDAAEAGGAILLFDEADALFGKRSEVKDSHDRYANIEVSYLLQRMETYRGLAILTTNLKNSLDTAFLRRIRFVVQFPFPDVAQRAEIWRRVFPAATPTESLDVQSLARLNVAGGNIRNIALNAAFLAAEADEPVRTVHLLHATRTEYAKLEKSLTEAEIGDWQQDEL